MNIFRVLAVKDLDEATRAIPEIDFAPAFLGEPGGLDAVAARVPVIRRCAQPWRTTSRSWSGWGSGCCRCCPARSSCPRAGLPRSSRTRRTSI